MLPPVGQLDILPPVNRHMMHLPCCLYRYTLEDNSPYARPLKHRNAVPHYEGKAAGKDIRLDDLDEELVSNRKASEPASDKISDMNLSPQQVKHRYCGECYFDLCVMLAVSVLLFGICLWKDAT